MGTDKKPEEQEVETPPVVLESDVLTDEQLDELADKMSLNIADQVLKAVDERIKLAEQVPTPDPEPEEEPEKKRGFPYLIVFLLGLTGIGIFAAAKSQKAQGTAPGTENDG